MVYEKPNTKELLDSEPAQEGFQYCSCKMDIGGMMLFCSYTKCRKGQWFHIDCLGMSEEDVPEGDWFCSEECRKLKNSRKNKSAISERFRDLKKEYAHRLLWRGLNDLARADAVSENDGLRVIRHWKFDFMEFYEKHHPKYFVFAHRLLSNVAGEIQRGFDTSSSGTKQSISEAETTCPKTCTMSSSTKSTKKIAEMLGVSLPTPKLQHIVKCLE
ncbi:uncharacterized protein LOC133198767 [Saccostrea echinata]|uniref:uncharacterized protein LOC133198767 n=1 Tax=Saccostrea echinata TaxID=191078 RepID=UPI002A8277EF|nr:uncharacterized protein LOC133198767 [Saccostrea echinata]